MDQWTVRSDSCTDGLCSTIFTPSSSDQTYYVSVSVINIFGESSSTLSKSFSELLVKYQHRACEILVFCLPVDGLSAFSLSLTFDNCMTSVLCSYPLSEGYCYIHYGQDPSHQDVSPPIQGPLNSPFTLPLMDENTFYYYLVNNTFGIQLIGNFTTGECKLVCYNDMIMYVSSSLYNSCCQVNIY